MKTTRTIALFLLCMGLLFSTTSSVVYQTKRDNVKHVGWYKNSHNPHHPYSTNPDKSQSNHKK